MVDPARPFLVGAAEAASLVSPAAGGAFIGALVGRPLLAVRLDDPGAVVEVADAVATLPVVVVGVLPDTPEPTPAPEVLARFDVLVGPVVAEERSDPREPAVVHGPEVGALVDRLVAGVARSPAAAVTLAQLLRAGEHLTLADAVVAESWAYSMLQAGPDHRAWLAGRVRPDPHGRAIPRAVDEVVRVARTGDRLEVTLARPAVRNAVDRRLRDELHEALAIARVDPTLTAVHLRGDGPSFCSGGDLDEFGSAPDPVTAHLVRTSRSPALALAAIATSERAELVAHVHGAAVGAGMEWAAFAERVIVRDDARFRLPEVAMGLVPGAGGTASIPRRIGRHRTLWLALTGEALDAGTAVAWGLADELVGDDAFVAALHADDGAG